MKKSIIIILFVLINYINKGFSEEDDIWGEVSEKENSEDSFFEQLTQRLDINGYLENQLTYQRLSSKNFLNYYLRLRIDIKGELNKNISYWFDGVGLYYFGDRTFKLKEVLPKKSWEIAEQRLPNLSLVEDYFVYELPQEFYLDNGYIKLNIEPLNITVGIQQLGQGVGYVWNPTDPFIKKDIMQPNYEQRGIPAIKIEFPFITWGKVIVVASPKEGMENWVLGGRTIFHFPHGEISLTAYTMEERLTDYISITDLYNFYSLKELPYLRARRVLLGGDFEIDIKGVKLYTEGGYNFLRGNNIDKELPPQLKDWWEIVLGIEYFFSFQTHIILEYLYYGRGKLHNYGYSLEEWLWYLEGKLRALGNHYLFINIDHPVKDEINIGTISIINFTDFSSLILAQFQWEFYQDVVLSFVFGYGVGDEKDELSLNKIIGWIRLKLYY